MPRLHSGKDDCISRRRFLQTSFAIAALTLTPALQAADRSSIAGFAARDDEGAREFFATLPAHCERWDSGLSETAERLLYAPDSSLPDMIAGLSHNGDLTVLGQLAEERGYVRSFSLHGIAPTPSFDDDLRVTWLFVRGMGVRQ